MSSMAGKKDAALNYYISEHFLYSDFICPCCDRIKIVPGLYQHIALMEQMAELSGREILVTSGYRCKRHNREIGGAPGSWHLLFATDITVDGGDETALSELYNMAVDIGFGGIGLYETHLHLDLRPDSVHWKV